jgi:hypothetical protein
MILGGTRWTEEAVQQVERFAERAQIPVGCSFRRQMLFDHLHPCYAGDVGIGINPALAGEIKEFRSGAAGRRAFLRNALLGLHADGHPASRASRWCMSMPTATSSAASTARHWRSTPIRPRSPKRCPPSTRSPHLPGARRACTRKDA